MDLIYVDYNCFQRGFDDPSSIKIQMEALTCEEIFRKAERKEIELVWSFMHEDENILCPFMERKLVVEKLSTICHKRVGPKEEVLRIAKEFQQKANLSSKDAIHLACAKYVGCKYFNKKG
jgi:predicted nucleic acid-binding protein